MQNINLLDTNLYKFFPKRNQIHYIFLVLGFISSWPLFFDAKTLSIILIDFTPIVATYQLDAVPVPIGLLSLSFYILLLMIRTKSLFFLVRSLSIYLLILTPILLGFDLDRIPVLITPIIFLIILKRLVKIKYIPNDGFVIGYLIGLLILYFSNILSYLYFSLIGGEFLDFRYSKQIFGFEIWQYFITYSAIASLVCGTCLLYMKDNFKILSKFKIFLFLIFLFSLISSTLTFRKAALLEFFILNLIFFRDFLFNLRFSKLSKFNFIFVLITTCGFLFFGNLVMSGRELDVGDRFMIIEKFIFILKDIDIFSFLFGLDRGTLGGYSSLFIELFVRNGVIGFLVYLSVLSYCLFSYFRNLFNIPDLPKSENYSLVFFVLTNALIGNLVNINFAVPYYSINFACILLTIYSIDCTSRLRKLV